MDNAKKIAIFHPIDDFYGASKILALTSVFLAKDYACDVYVFENTGSLESLINTSDKIRIIEMSYIPLAHRKMYTLKGLTKWGLNNVRMIIFFIKNKKKYKFVYVNTLSIFSLCIATKIVGITSVIHCHEYLLDSFYGKVIRFCVCHSADLVISVSYHVNSYISDGSNKFYVVHNGIPDLRVPPSFKYKQGNKVKFVLVGRVMPEKGHWFLLDSLSRIDKCILEKITIDIFGDAPPTRSELMNDFKIKVKELSLDNVFNINGFCSDIDNKLHNYDVCLVPSLMADPFPTTVIEGIRAGRIVVTTDHGGAKEVIRDKENGFLIRPNEIDNFANVILEIVSLTKEKRMDLQIKARKTFDDHYNIVQFHKRFCNVFKKLVIMSDDIK